MSEDAPDELADTTAGEMVPRSRLNDKERKYQEAVSTWSARETLMQRQIETLTGERDEAVAARESVAAKFDTMNGELSTMRQKFAFDGAGIRDEALQTAIVGMFNTTPEDQRGDGGLAGWLVGAAYDNPLVAPHLPRRAPQDAPNEPAPSAATASFAAPTFNQNARAPSSPPAKYQGIDLLDHLRRQTAGMTPADARKFLAAEKARYTGS